MKEKLISLLALSLLLTLSGCITSRNPLSSPKTAKPDARLLGNWKNSDSNDAMRITPFHGAWMHWEEIDPKTLKPTPSNYSYDFYPTIIGDKHFQNVRLIEYNSKTHRRENLGYTFVRYEFAKNGDLVFWSISKDAVERNVKTGRLKGHMKKSGDVYLEASSRELVNFIKTSDITKLFDHKNTYRKIP